MPLSAPKPSNYQDTALKDQQSSADVTSAQTQANRANTATPFGFTNWTQGPNGQWQMQTGFDPAMSGAVSGAQQQLIEALRQPVMTGDAAREQAIQAAYGQATSRLDPQWSQREEALRTQLLNQGLDPNSEAARNAMTQMGQQRNDAYSSAMNSAIGQGTAAGESVFRQNLAAQQAPLQSMQGLFSLLSQPEYHAAGRADPLQSMQAAALGDAAALKRFEAQNKIWADYMSGAGELAKGLSGVVAASDERLKQRVVRLPVEVLPGVPLASWEYRSRPGVRRLGVIAQDLERVAPRYVLRDGSGMRWVDYSFLEELRWR